MKIILVILEAATVATVTAAAVVVDVWGDRDRI